MKHCLLSIFLLLGGATIFAQGSTIADSLENELKDTKDQQKQLYLMLDIMHASRSDFDRTEKYMDKSIDLARELKDQRGEVEAMNLKAAYLLLKNKVDESLEISLKVIEVYKELKDTINIGNSHLNIGVTMLSEKRYEKSRKYLDEALEIFQSIDHLRGIGGVEMSLGHWFSFQNRADSALIHFLRGAAIYDELKIFTESAVCWMGAGNEYRAIGNNKDAVRSLVRAREMLMKATSTESVDISLGLSEVYMNLKDYDSSRYWARIGMSSATLQNDFNAISKLSKVLYKSDSAQGNWKSATEHLLKSYTYYDSLMQEETAYKVEFMEAEYRAGQTELELEKSRLNEQLESEKTKKTRLYWVLTIIGGVFALIVALLIINRQKLRLRAKTAESERQQVELDKSKLEKERLKERVEHKERELTTVALANAEKMEMLERIRAKVKETDSENQLIELKSLLNEQVMGKNEWGEFRMRFEQVHPEFTQKLLKLGSDLTANDIKICILLRLNLSSKQISAMVGISPKSVDMSRYRIRKKIDLDSSRNLQDYILTI